MTTAEDLLEIKLFGARGQELTRESLYEEGDEGEVLDDRDGAPAAGRPGGQPGVRFALLQRDLLGRLGRRGRGADEAETDRFRGFFCVAGLCFLRRPFRTGAEAPTASADASSAPRLDAQPAEIDDLGLRAFLGSTGVVVCTVVTVAEVPAPLPDAEEPELETDVELDLEVGLAAVALAASVVVLTAADVAGELGVEELPQPARPAPARIATVTHIDGMRRNSAPLL